MMQSIKSKVILSTLLFAVVFAVAMFFATNSFATEELAEADSTPTATEDVAASEEAVATEESAAADENAEALPESAEAAATEESAAKATPQANLDTVETQLDNTGLSLIGEFEAIPGSDYTLDSDDLTVLTENWTITGQLDTTIYNSFWIKVNADTISIEDLTQKNNALSLYLDTTNESSNPLVVNIEGNNNITMLRGVRQTELKGNGNLAVWGIDRATTLKTGGINFYNNTSLTINGPEVRVVNETDREEGGLCLNFTQGDTLNLNKGKLICEKTNAPEENPTGSLLNKLVISEEAELFISSNNFAAAIMQEPTISNINAFKVNSSNLKYDQRSQVTNPAIIEYYEFYPETYLYAFLLEGTNTLAQTIYKPAGNPPEPTPPEPTPPVPGTEEVASAQTGDGSIAGIIMLVAIASGVCFASINIRRKYLNKA